MPWIHRGCVSLPFTDFTWRHIHAVVERRGDRVEHERQLAQSLDCLLRRASSGAGTRREQTVAARASAAASLAQPASPQAAPDPVAVPTLSYGLVGAFAPLEEEDQEGETRFEDSWDEDDDLSGAADPGAPCGHGWPDSPAQAPRPSRIYDARQEAAQW
ncbi:hypothetical protein [Streptomyces malaysiensis]|uniref:hypothetical protein n=1 Tax=Streptomyces malaysiensis TaxID=92644 RepID=UPI000A7E2028|nr:hypothetical protein [Streptomyces sp. SPMA113]